MLIALVGGLAWLAMLTAGIALGVAAKRGDDLAAAAYRRARTTERSAVRQQRGARPVHHQRSAQRLHGPAVKHCDLCGAQR
jgi:hypothetical protein